MIKEKHRNFQKDNSGECLKRIYFLLAVIVLFFLVVIGRLYFLQVVSYDVYRGMADNQHFLNKEILPLRGEIFLKEKEGLFPAAVNQDLMTVYVVPKEIEQIENTANKLAEILGLDKNDILIKLSRPQDSYKLIKRKISDQEKDNIKKNVLKGVYLTPERWRYYPGGNLASQTIGFLGYQGDKLVGQYGLEKYFEKKLCGKEGLLRQEKDAGGRWISIGEKKINPAQNGVRLVLSIDHTIQFKAEVALQNAVQRHQADGGKVIIVDPATGKILAMAAYPTFDLNNYSKVEDMNNFRNPVISDAFESGSVFKGITMATGLDTENITPETIYNDTGQVKEAGFTIKNSDLKANGQQTMTNVIEKSLNTGVIFVQKLVGNELFLKYIKDFGFGQTTGIELPNESPGNISNLSSKRNIEFFTAAFGQGITVTPLQLAMAYTAIANGGELLKPHIIESITDSLGKTENTQREVVRRVISKNTANQVAMMLEANVLNGHGKLAGVPGYRIAGKTGTAQIPDKEKGGYLKGATVGSFIGFGPLENPKFVMLVSIDRPRDVQWAESTAGPLFGELAYFLLNYYTIEPTEDFTSEDMLKFTKTHNYLAPLDPNTTEIAPNVPIKESQEKNKKKKKDNN